MREAELQDLSDPYSRLVQDFKFSDGKDGLYFLRVILQRNGSDFNTIKWEKVMWSACKPKDKVRYFEATLNPEHVAALRSVSIPFMNIISPSGQPLIKRECKLN